MVTQASKFLLAGVAAAGAGYYFYEQRNGGKLIDMRYDQGPAEHAGRVVDSYASSGWNKVEETKNSAAGWIGEKGSQARQGVDQVADSAKSVADTGSSKAAAVGGGVKSWFQDSRASAERAYSDSWEKLNEAQKQFDETKAAWWSWGAKKNEEAHKQAERNLNAAKQNYDESRNALSKWGQDTIDATDKKLREWKKAADKAAASGAEQVNSAVDGAKKQGSKLKDAVDGSYQSAKSKAEELQYSAEKKKDDLASKFSNQVATDAELAKQVRKSVEGWGETAQEVAQEEYEGLYNKKGTLFQSSQEAAQKAKEFYEQQAKDAKKRYDETRGSWFSWGSAKSKETQDEARRQWEEVQRKSDEASKAWSDWTKDNSDKLVKQTQDGLDRAHQQSQGFLSGVRNWIRGN